MVGLRRSLVTWLLICAIGLAAVGVIATLAPPEPSLLGTSGAPRHPQDNPAVSRSTKVYSASHRQWACRPFAEVSLETKSIRTSCPAGHTPVDTG